MLPILLCLLTVLAIAWATQAVLAAIQVYKFSLAFKQGRRPAFDAYQPSAVVIVPFKGADDDLPAAMRALCAQNYRDYRLLLVVDSADDPAYDVLQREAKQYPRRRIDIVVAGRASDRESQKIHNQLFAIGRLTDADEVWVFADSDAAPGDDWLMDMVGPLIQEQTGMTTAYRWLIPSGGGGGGTASHASRFASVINSTVACAFRKKRLSQAWGGAMALRAATARQGDLAGHLRGALTDDYQFTRMCRQLGRRVYFVPRALAPTPAEFTWATFFNFAHRQYLITRVYAPALYGAALLVTSLYVAGMAATWALLVLALADVGAGGLWPIPVAAIAVVFIANQVRAYFRRQAIRRAFSHQTLAALRSTLRLDRWGTPVWMTLHWLLVLRALVGRTMIWRGIHYQLRGPQDVRRMEPADKPG